MKEVESRQNEPIIKMIARRVLGPGLPTLLGRGFFDKIKRLVKGESEQLKRSADSKKLSEEKQKQIPTLDQSDILQRKIDNELRLSASKKQAQGPRLERLGEGGIQQIYFWRSKQQLSPMDVALALLRCKQLGSTKDARFQQLYHGILESMLVMPRQSLPALFLLAKRYSIDSEEYWYKLQKRALPLVGFATLDQVKTYLECSAAMPRLVDELFVNSLEKRVEGEQGQLTLQFLGQVVKLLRQGRFGSKQFLGWLSKRVRERLNQIDQQTVLPLFILSKQAKLEQEQLAFSLVDGAVVGRGLVAKMSVNEVGECLSMLLYEDGSRQLNSEMIGRVLREARAQQLQDCKLVIKAMVANYKMPTAEFKKWVPSFQQQVGELGIGQLCSLQKYSFICDCERVGSVEDRLVERLGEEIGIEDLYEITFSYHMTRKARRQTYHLLERKIREQVRAILVTELGERFHRVLTESNLCTPELLMLFHDYTAD